MHGHDVGALIDQRVRGRGFLGLVGPAAGHHHARLRFGVDRASTHLEGVDVADRIPDGNADHEAERVRLRHLPGCNAHGIPGRLGCPEEIAEVRRLHPAARVLEHDIRMAFGQIEGELLVAEAGREDQLCALLDHAFHDPLSFRRLGNVFRLDQLEAGNVTLHLLETVLHGAVVAVVIDTADVDRSNRQRLVLCRHRTTREQRCKRRACCR